MCEKDCQSVFRVEYGNFHSQPGQEVRHSWSAWEVQQSSEQLYATPHSFYQRVWCQWLLSLRNFNSRLAKRLLVFNGYLANRGLTSLVKEATGSCHDASFPITAGTGNCLVDNPRSHQWGQSWHHDNLWVTVNVMRQYWEPLRASDILTQDIGIHQFSVWVCSHMLACFPLPEPDLGMFFKCCSSTLHHSNTETNFLTEIYLHIGCNYPVMLYFLHSFVKSPLHFGAWIDNRIINNNLGCNYFSMC